MKMHGPKNKMSSCLLVPSPFLAVHL